MRHVDDQIDGLGDQDEEGLRKQGTAFVKVRYVDLIFQAVHCKINVR